jgi:hypothetical protein
MAFEIFTETRARSAEFISINETQAFGFSRAFLDAYGITKDHKAIILFDDEQNKIALHFTKEDVKFGFSVQANNEKHGGIVKAKSFFDRKRIDAAKYARRYQDFEVVDIASLGIDGKGEAFVLSLEETNGSKGGDSRTAAAVFPDIKE